MKGQKMHETKDKLEELKREYSKALKEAEDIPEKFEYLASLEMAIYELESSLNELIILRGEKI